ncbi:leucyl/phenylalanyl-tRNA--protein transferase [Sphingobacterium yanglingense]|uniref:Leucyl/phenylalanyl-tRNA--protein transferase n=1 Tax=Sphingobacterium yanglingense TaxID=1437280 RepID=A0A4R6WAR6_9SPHI|nr:leucyl/phenylalanyl-tRNA--protein transferase [Sphingobacterium yanglingense]TDQ76448.1 leucyl/phenylalanyl-tRNA--protein transferase [Sphingobacterium yanglingense]
MVFQLDEDLILFPDVQLAEEDGLLAVGGDLRTERLLEAYKKGIFPWYSDDTPILWYAPHERFILYPQQVKVSKSMAKVLAKNIFELSFNTCFEDVMQQCSTVARRGQDGTWIVDDMLTAYARLHQEGYAHSIEVRQGGNLVGGLYGVLIGKVFCGESMFSKVPDASKAALIYLCQNFDLQLIDCQIYSSHLASMGATTVDASFFYRKLQQQEVEINGLQKLFRYS